ncbi:MAG: hypothetical protein SwStaBPW_28530 [Shewanella algae]
MSDKTGVNQQHSKFVYHCQRIDLQKLLDIGNTKECVIEAFLATKVSFNGDAAELANEHKKLWGNKENSFLFESTLLELLSDMGLVSGRTPGAEPLDIIDVVAVHGMLQQARSSIQTINQVCNRLERRERADIQSALANIDYLHETMANVLTQAISKHNTKPPANDSD